MTRRLLLADDSITIQKVVELVLAEEDIEIKSVSNGEDALNLIESFNPDIVLADIEMPKLNGYQLCEKIKNNPKTASIPVILLAGAFEPIDNELSLKVGADDSVIKPFESQELIGKINSVLTMGAIADMEEAEAIAEPMDEAYDLGEEIEDATQPELAEPMGEEDLWAMEDLTETPTVYAVEALTGEELLAAETVSEVHVEKVPVETPKPAPVAAAAAEQPAVKKEPVIHEIAFPSSEEVLALIDRKVGEQTAALFSALHRTLNEKIDLKLTQALDQKLDLKDAVLQAITPMMKDSIERILWETAPELVEKVTKEAVKGAFSSITSEVEKVLWETLPELANSIITKEIEKIKASS